MKMYLNAYRIFGEDNSILTPADLKEARNKYSLRRSDRFTAMAVAAVTKLMGDQFPDKYAAETGLITATAFGPHRTTFATLDDILDYPEDLILPTRFSHSVHNAAASYIGVVLGLKGITFALAGFEDIWFEALELAENMMMAGFCRQIMVIGIEESGLLTENAPQLWKERFSEPPREAVCVFLLSKDPECGHHGELRLDKSEIQSEQLFTFGLYRQFLDSLANTTPETVSVLHKLPCWKFI